MSKIEKQLTYDSRNIIQKYEGKCQEKMLKIVTSRKQEPGGKNG